MTIFDTLNSILFNKRKLDTKNMEFSKNYEPFLVNRWVSMLDGSAAILVNETVNKLATPLLSKEEQYNMLYNILPKYKQQRINYIKKVKG